MSLSRTATLWWAEAIRSTLRRSCLQNHSLADSNSFIFKRIASCCISTDGSSWPGQASSAAADKEAAPGDAAGGGTGAAIPALSRT